MNTVHNNLTYNIQQKYWYFCPKHCTSNEDTKLRAIYIPISALTRQRISKLLNVSVFLHVTSHIISSKQCPSYSCECSNRLVNI